MASEVTLGFVAPEGGGHVEVLRHEDGRVTLFDLRTFGSIILRPEERDQLRELLDRAATPGQVSAFRRPCCDHCNNLQGDPDGHDYTLDGPHGGPCEKCAEEAKCAEVHAEVSG